MMIIPYSKYVLVKKHIDSLLKSSKLPTVELANELDICYDAFLSLYSQIQVRVLKRDMRRFDQKTVRNIVNRVHNNQELLSTIAREYSFSSYRLASMYLDNVTGGRPLITVPDLRENPRALHNFFDKLRTRVNSSGGCHSVTGNQPYCPSIAQVDIITADILTSCYAEDSCSNWSSDVSKQVMGQEYEEHLMSRLDHLGACYDSEEVLRGKGKAKTPDVLFAIPMGVHLPHYYPVAKSCLPSASASAFTSHPASALQAASENDSELATACDSNKDNHGGDGREANRNISMKLFSSDGDDVDADGDTPSPRGDMHGYSADSIKTSSSTVTDSTASQYVVINWIDSKALCADEESFQQNLDQVQSYVNRYGSGLIIYWQGFVETIPNIIAGRARGSGGSGGNDGGLHQNSTQQVQHVVSQQSDLLVGGSHHGSSTAHALAYVHAHATQSNRSHISPDGHDLHSESIFQSSISTSIDHDHQYSTHHNHDHDNQGIMIYVSDHFPLRWMDPTGQEIFAE